MRKRKTFDVESFKKFVNEQLERTDDHATIGNFKSGLCIALERVLHDTGNYQGYNILYWLEKGCDEWEKNGKPQNWGDKVFYVLGTADSKYKGCNYARRYY